MKVDIFDTIKKYKVIYADPPWEYKQSGSFNGKRGMAKWHYNTMSTDEICKLPIKSLKTEDAVLFIWATFPNIKEALRVMEAWGFVYKTAAFVWIKQNKRTESLFWGMGSYTRANAEICLLGLSPKTKGKNITKSHKVHQVIISPIREHSRKPEEARKRIEKLVGGVSKIELFARDKEEEWDYWGDEV